MTLLVKNSTGGPRLQMIKGTKFFSGVSFFTFVKTFAIHKTVMLGKLFMIFFYYFFFAFNTVKFLAICVTSLLSMTDEALTSVLISQST